MKIFLTSILLIILSSCSFDNKTGIWKNSNEVNSKKEERFKDFETLYTEAKSFDSLIEPKNNLEIILDPIQLNLKWTDEYYKDSNNLDNFNYKDLNELIFKSKKLSRHKIKNRLLYDNQKVIISDDKGNIIVYSIEDQKIILKYNFYKKKFKKIKKNLNTIVEKNIIYIGDNFGYLYALDYVNNRLLWAKNYKIPFRSNFKIKGNKLLISDINNSLYFVNKANGEKLRVIPTEETIVKNDFVNSLVSSQDSLFYLNTYGSLYSIDDKGRIKWFINLNRSLDINPSNLFYSNPIVLHQDRLFVSTDLYLYILNSNNGSTLFKIAITSLLKPIISGKNLFLITKDNLLVCINLNNGEIVYSVDINQNIADFLDTKKKSVNIKSLAIINNDLFLFLNNSYLVRFSSSGKIKNINKLPSKLGSFPTFINESIIYLNNRNKLAIIN
jgi:outer membrane protein assembly factor BamB